MTQAAHNGFVGQSGVQAHSAGSHFPAIISSIGDDLFVHCPFGQKIFVKDYQDAEVVASRFKLAESICDQLATKWQPGQERKWASVPYLFALSVHYRGQVKGNHGPATHLPAEGYYNELFGFVLSQVLDGVAERIIVSRLDDGSLYAFAE